jgi:hypothetical protein
LLANKDGHVRIRANIGGEVELRAKVGETIRPRQILAVIEGESEIESLSVRRISVVMEHLVECGSEVTAHTSLMVVREIED